MGVKELWTILSPVSEKKSLWELQNKTIAIDLSAWICDSQNVCDNSHRNMYLRNLFFRTSFLLLLGAKPLYVLEGAAPELKHRTIVARSQVRNGHKDKDSSKSSSRSYLRNLQKQCEKLLNTMGISCVQSSGEAEAYCAWLNENNIVDAVITQDSDSLLYGAKIVYRQFTMSPTYTCESHDVSVIKNKLNLGRNKLLALSLLCGCDYDKGVNGVGKELALKFLSTLEEDEVLDRLRSWRDNIKYDIMESKGVRNLTSEQKLELTIRKKALQTPDFPSEDIINEYLSYQSNEDIPIIQWGTPNLVKFLEIADRKLNWEEQYAIEKFFPLMTRWHLLHSDIPYIVSCDAITKKRIVRGINSFECRWSAPELMLDETVILSTVEPQDLVHEVYGDLAEAFLDSKKKKTKKGPKKTKTKKSDKENVDNATNIEELLHNMSIDEEKTQTKTKQPNKRRLKNKLTNGLVACKGLQTLDKFFNIEINEPEVYIDEQISHINKLLEMHAVNGVLNHSTPKRLTETKNVKTDYDVSVHYNSDVSLSPSPLKHKNRVSDCTSLNLNEKSASKCSVDITERWSLTNYTSSQKSNTLKQNLLEKSMTASFLNDTNTNDNDDFNMSDIINCIVKQESNLVCNPAVNMLLKANSDH